MNSTLASRLLLIPMTLLGVSLIVFIVMRALPGDIVDTITAGGPPPSAQQRAVIRKQLGIDKPLPSQYLNWVGQLARFDFGVSLSKRQPIGREIWRRMPVTLELSFLAIVFSTVVGVSIGSLSALRRNSSVDYGLRLFALVGLSLPLFWIQSFVRNFILPRYFHWLPPTGYSSLWIDPWTNIQQMWLPALLLGFSLSALTSRISRSAMLDVLRQDYVRTARAKGLASRVVVIRHALRNALIPVVTLMGIQFGALLGGAVITESIFSLPGIGSYALEAIGSRDYPVVQAIVCVSALIYLVLNLTVDLAIVRLDPRVRR